IDSKYFPAGECIPDDQAFRQDPAGQTLAVRAISHPRVHRQRSWGSLDGHPQPFAVLDDTHLPVYFVLVCLASQQFLTCVRIADPHRVTAALRNRNEPGAVRIESKTVDPRYLKLYHGGRSRTLEPEYLLPGNQVPDPSSRRIR